MQYYSTYIINNRYEKVRIFSLPFCHLPYYYIYNNIYNPKYKRGYITKSVLKTPISFKKFRKN